MVSKNICIIPARGGSKRIPRKNIKDFLGKPIIAYSIEAALKSGVFSEVMVSTDDEEISEISRSYGANVPFFRTSQNSNDFATTADVLVEVITKYSKRGIAFDNFCCLYPTVPFITPEKLVQGYTKLIDLELDTLITVQPFSYPIQRALKVIESKVSWVDDKYALTRSQDLEKVYHDAGQFYFANINVFMEAKELITSKTGMLELSELEGQDIDNQIDWEIAELKYKLLLNQR